MRAAFAGLSSRMLVCIITASPAHTPRPRSCACAERVLCVQVLWDRIAAEPDGVPLSEAQRLELRRRVEEHRADPGSALPWEQVLARARAPST